MVVHTQPTLFPGMSARIAEAAALSPSSFQLVEDTEDDSSDSGTEREGSEEEGPDSEDEGHGSEDEGPGEGEMPSTFEVGCSSRSVPELEGAERIYSFRQPTIVTWVDPEDGRVYTNILTYVPPAAPVQILLSLESGAVRDEIFSQCYRFRSLKQEQERATVTFSAIWRPNENHDLRMNIADERRERLELIDRVAKRGRRQESRGEY
ncbi:hypothetical protein Tco_1564364 [Tanacetum coccineum]